MLGKECLSLQMTFSNLIYFPFHLGFQETHGKIQGLIVGITSSWILVNIHFFFPFKSLFCLYIRFCYFILCRHCMFSYVLGKSGVYTQEI